MQIKLVTKSGGEKTYRVCGLKNIKLHIKCWE